MQVDNEACANKAKIRKYNTDSGNSAEMEDDISKDPTTGSDSGSHSTANTGTETMSVDTFSSPWMGQYAFVKSVFQLLPLKDLLAAGNVCRFWSEVGGFVREARRNLANTILWHPYSEQGRTREAVEYYNDVQISDEVNQFMESASPAFVDVLDLDLPNEKFREWGACFRRDFIQQFSESQMVVLFATKSFAQYIQTIRKRFSKKTEQDAIFGLTIPKTVPCVCAFGCGLAFTMPNSTTMYEMERTELPMVTGLLVPRVRGLSTRVVSFDKGIAHLYKRRKSVTSENCKKILGISPAENVKGFIFLDADSYGRYTNPFMDAAFHYIKDNPTICFAGGNVFNTLSSESEEEMNKQLGFGVLISGDDDSVKVGTVGLFEQGITPENETKLKKFQSLVSHGEGSFAFMFACNGRGAHMHGKEHVEVTLFRRYYPSTPIIGIFTNGELAHEYLPGEDRGPPPENRAALEFTFSTIFLFVSYKHK